MAALGVLEEVRPADLFSSEGSDLARPGSAQPRLLATGRSKNASDDAETLRAAFRQSAERERDRAARKANDAPSSTAFAALAQAHAALDERDEAVEAARRALAASLDPIGQATDVSSARVSAEVMHRFGRGQEAYDSLAYADGSGSLTLTRALIASDLGRPQDALNLVEGRVGPMFDAFRGYVLASQEMFQQAVPHLRAALREVPDDADSALNLSVALWNLGGQRKATSVALRAARTSPGRKDISLHLMDLLLRQGDFTRLAAEIRELRRAGVVPDSQFLTVEARLHLGQGNRAKALPLLERAFKEAAAEGNTVMQGEIASNSVIIRHDIGRITRDEMAAELGKLLDQYPENDAVVVNYAKVVDRRSKAPKLRAGMERVAGGTTPTRRAYLRHYVAFLEGDNETAASSALEWFESEPTNPQAAAAVLVAVGIGLERWNEAEKVADYAIANLPAVPVLVNNVAYILAMVGRADQAVAMMERSVAADTGAEDNGFVLRATLGLAYLAAGDVEKGMRCYRDAAQLAEQISPTWGCLMASYQALVVRQLNMSDQMPAEHLASQAIVPQSLPDDWEDRPDFLRLKFVSDRRGYDWPLTL
jgi:tetratricopeptide (TPR) repeat protein